MYRGGEVGPRFSDPMPWLILAAGVGSRNLGPILLTISLQGWGNSWAPLSGE